MKKYIKIPLAVLSAATLFISLIPLLILARYAGPASDDFGYATPLYYAIRNGENLFGILKALAENIRYTYLNWQGTFASVFLFTLQPGVFGDKLYILTPIIMMLVVIASQFITANALFSHDRTAKIITGSVISILALQFLPSIADGVYWWNGGVHYLVFWCLLVATVTGQIRISKNEITGKAFYFHVIITCFTAFLVGGGNYQTALICAVLLSLISAYNIYAKKERKIIIAGIIAKIINIAGLVISVIAPGNAVRQAGFEKISAIAAIGKSFIAAAEAIFNFTDIKILCALLLCVPVFFFSTRNRNYKFPCPLIMLFGSFCIFAAMYTPPLYAMGEYDADRMTNLFYMAYLTFMLANAFYLSGWLSQKFKKLTDTRILNISTLTGAAAFALCIIIQFTSTNAYKAYADLTCGDTLYTHTRERSERTAAFEDKTRLPRYTEMTGYPLCFIKANHLTWASDLIVDGKVADLILYRSCGGEVPFVGLNDAVLFFGCGNNLGENDFSKVFTIDQKTCIPLREFAISQGFDISYDTACDTIYITR